MNMIRRFVAVVLLLPAVAFSAEPRRPNVLVILADDLGFSDLGCHGGEIDTPHLDALAAGGLRFTQGYQTARCWPSRAALLTGYYPQAINRDALPGGTGGQNGKRPAWARLLPELLAPAGYRSYHSGKWHVDGEPLAQGFTRSLLVDAAAQSNYFTTQAVTEDGRPLKETADSYVTTLIGDHAIRCLRDHAAAHAAAPFFHYVAFTAPHFPLHAPADLIAKYRDRYRSGWDAVRAARVARLAKAGIVTTPAGEMERGVGLPHAMQKMRERLGPHEVDRPVAWAELTEEQQVFLTDKMAIHAAMVEAMDREVGRIVAELKAAGLFDDTFIFFASDNGASAEMLIRGEGHDPAAPPGSRKTFLCLGPGWSSCANAPFRRHKMWNHEGGIATPWIVHWPKGGLDAGGLRRQPVHLIDVAPTVLELAGVAPPATHMGMPVPPIHGRSFVKPLRDPDAPPIHDVLWWCHGGHRAVREGDWKLVADRGQAWELYDLAADRCETTNVAATHPDRVRGLDAKWTKIADDCRGLAATAGGEPRAAAPRPPNVVLVFCDDLGYGDPSCYGGKVPTPNIDRIAREGIRFTDFHVPHPVCSASRAALLTGCYSPRVSIHGALAPSSTHGISSAETTLAELLRDRGYRTACVGKWHLGHLPEFLPTRHGFHEWLGLPYSNDMWPPNGGRYPPLPLFDGERVIDPDVTAEDQEVLTGRYTSRAVDFIERSAKAADGRPFFLYLAHTMPHVPLFVGKAFRGNSAAGVYGDMVTEIDASVGAVLDALDRTGRAKDTLVLFTSDNGPWLLFGNHGGSAGPLREGKGTVFEGGIREPCVARLPGVIPAGSLSDALLASIDILPTVAALTGEPLPRDAEGSSLVAGKRIDGHDRRGAFMATEPPAVSDAVTQWYYFKGGELQAVRRGRWKLMLPHTARCMAGQEPGRDGRSGKPADLKIGRELYDLRTDIAEQHDVAARHPEIVAELEQEAEVARRELGDPLTGREGTGVRPAGGTVAATRPK
jgi:arylsulfatase A-like enzyme